MSDLDLLVKLRDEVYLKTNHYVHTTTSGAVHVYKSYEDMKARDNEVDYTGIVMESEFGKDILISKLDSVISPQFYMAVKNRTDMTDFEIMLDIYDWAIEEVYYKDTNSEMYV